MKVLVTGGAGFIGSHIVEHFISKNADVTVLDNLRTGNLDNITNFDINYISGDICDREAVAKSMQGVDYVFHLAAMVSVPESMKNFKECEDINISGTRIVLEEAAKANVKKLCLSSTSAIYGESEVSPKVETMYPEPQSPYASTKLNGEIYCNIFTKNGWLDCVSMRYFNVFGERQDPKSAYAAAIPIFTTNAAKGNDITVYGDGEQTRDFIYVKDIVATNVALSQSKLNGVYNVGYGKSITINSLIDKIVKTTKSSSRVIYEPIRAGDVKHSCSSIDKLKSAGIPLNDNFDDGLEKTIKFFMEKVSK